MAMDEIIWSVEGVNMPTPSTYALDYEDVDDESYRSVLDASLVREMIAGEFIKISFSYRYLTTEMIQTIRNALKTKKEFTVTAKSPILGNGEAVTFDAYCSKMHFEMLECQLGYSGSFNIIQVRK